MSWELILKRGNRASRAALENVDKIMSDGKHRTIKVILEELWDLIDNSNITGRYSIPTTAELKCYLGRNKKYSSDSLDPLTGNRANNLYREREYWRE